MRLYKRIIVGHHSPTMRFDGQLSGNCVRTFRNEELKTYKDSSFHICIQNEFDGRSIEKSSLSMII